MENCKTAYVKGGQQKEVYTEAELIYVPCPFCGSKQYEKIYTERGALGIVRCCNCRLLYVNPRVKNPGEVYWGNPEEYFKEARLIFEGKAGHHRDRNYREDLRIIYSYKPCGKLLDIGTNMGFFLRNARGRQWELYGVEPSPALSRMARDYFGLNVKTAYLEEAAFAQDSFDIVTMTDVLEHITGPKTLLEEVRRVIKPDGIVYIKVPNGKFNLLKLFLSRRLNLFNSADLFDAYEHVVHYTKETLTALLRSCGFIPRRFYIGRPIHLPAWHKYLGSYYQYPSPWCLDAKNFLGREIFYWLAKLEYNILPGRIGYFAPNIIVVAKKEN